MRKQKGGDGGDPIAWGGGFWRVPQNVRYLANELMITSAQPFVNGGNSLI